MRYINLRLTYLLTHYHVMTLDLLCLSKQYNLVWPKKQQRLGM